MVLEMSKHDYIITRNSVSDLYLSRYFVVLDNVSTFIKGSMHIVYRVILILNKFSPIKFNIVLYMAAAGSPSRFTNYKSVLISNFKWCRGN